MLSGGFCNTHHNGDTVLMMMMVLMVIMVIMVMMMVNLVIFRGSCHPLSMSGYYDGDDGERSEAEHYSLVPYTAQDIILDNFL